MGNSKNNSMIGPGAMGDIRVYERMGEKVVRMRHNARKPRSKTVDSLGQKTRYMNVVQSWSRFGGLLRGNFELKPANQTDYNAFLANNLPNARVYLTQAEVKGRSAVVDNFVISKGVLEPRVEVELGEEWMVSNIAVGGLEISAETPMYALAGTIVERNKGFLRPGDELVFYRATQVLQSPTLQQGPYFAVHATRLPLSTGSQLTLREVFRIVDPAWHLIDGLENHGGFLAARRVENSLVAWVQRRPAAGGKGFSVSTQRLVGENNYLAAYATEEARMRAIESYGATDQTYAASPRLAPVVDPFEVKGEAPMVEVEVIGGVMTHEGHRVEGGKGRFRVGEKLRITATPSAGWKFFCWEDGDTNPIREVVVVAPRVYDYSVKQDAMAMAQRKDDPELDRIVEKLVRKKHEDREVD